MWCLLIVASLAAESPLPSGPAGSVTLHVGVHREAGTLYDIAADGAAGQCTAHGSRLSCPADGPVRFRWRDDGRWALTGSVELEVGSVGQAWVLAHPTTRAEALARLAPERVTADDVRDLFVRTGDHPVEPPSWEMLQALFALTDHPDRLVRRATVDALVPWWRHTASDPLPADAPQIIPAGLLRQMGEDLDPVVRKRLANRLREVNMPGEPLQAEAEDVLQELAEEFVTQRPATASLAVLSRAGRANPEESWWVALEAVTTPGPRGRAAANAFARLAGEVEPGPGVDPQRALALVFAYHRERTWTVWAAWRHEIPFDPSLFAVLLRETEGYHVGLLVHFAQTAPAELARTLRAWEPAPPHSPRWKLVTGPLRSSTDPDLRALFPEP